MTLKGVAKEENFTKDEQTGMTTRRVWHYGTPRQTVCKGKQDRSGKTGKDCDYVAEVSVTAENNLNGIVAAGTTGEQPQNEKSVHLFPTLCCTLE